MADILVIDDDPQMRRLLVRILTRAGHSVREAANGTVGLTLFHQARPALIITDIVMPDGEGIETIRSVRLEDTTLPIIAISGANSALYLSAAGRLGATASLSKPFAPDELVAKVEELLGSA